MATQNFNDNFSAFLSEYNSNTGNQLKWIDEQLQNIVKAIQSIQNGTKDEQLRTALQQPLLSLSTVMQEPVDKIIASLKDLLIVFEKNKPTQDMTNTMSSFRRMINIYINIARNTSNEDIARLIIQLVDTVGLNTKQEENKVTAL